MKSKLVLATTWAALTLAQVAICQEAAPAEKPASVEKAASVDEDRPVVQIAILLDNSGSMQGLIEQAKTEIWRIVNEFAVAKQNGKAPRIEVGIYEYGIANAQDNGSYLHQVVPLTDNLDLVSEKLFAINQRDAGSEEFCGWVIKEAVEKFKWDKSAKGYRAIFIAGNEEFTQDKVNYKAACQAAIGKGIMVNTIHCGNEAEGIRGKWKDAAAMSDGRFLVIDHNAVAVSPPAPQDKDIALLNDKLNDSYVSYGRKGAEGKANQLAQDANAAKSLPGTMSGRAGVKASHLYKNDDWDLVDRAKDKNFDVTKLDAAELPEEMKKLTPKERVEYVDKKREEREQVQKKLKILSDERAKFLAEKSKGEAGKSTLGSAVTKAVHEQAEKKGLKFEQ